MTRPIEFRIDGRDVTLKAMSGRQAYEIAERAAWYEFFPESLEEEDRLWVWSRIADTRDPMTLRSLWRIAHGMAPEVYGVEWWSACRLAGARRRNWLPFEAWTVRNGFDPNPRWVEPRRITAALMAWLAESCKKEVEWQQLEMQVLVPPEYAVWLPERAGEEEESAASASSFQGQGPSWAIDASAQALRGDVEDEQEEAEEEIEETPEAPAEADEGKPWEAQPAMGLDDFMSQAKAWTQARNVGAEGVPPTEQEG